MLFIAKKIVDELGRADKYAVLKILYFAEKKHLVEYGRLITDDRFATLKFGPVPSNCYDLLDYNQDFFEQVNTNFFKPLAAPDIGQLSKSDVLCLEAAVKENKSLSFQQLKLKSYDKAYHSAFDHSKQWMSIEEIAEQEGADDILLGYIKEHYEIQNYARCVPV